MRTAELGCVAVLALAAGQASAGLMDNLQGYWQFNGSGADSSGNGRDATLYGGAGYGGGLFGQGLSLTGNNANYAARPVDDAVFNFGSSNYTIQVWVNYNHVSGEQTLLEKFSGSGGPGWTLTTLGSTIRFYYHGALQLDGGTVAAGAWNHILFRRDGGTGDMFVNGVLVGPVGLADGTSSSNPLLFGKRNDGSGQVFPLNGVMDEVAIWNRALTNQEVADLYNGGNGLAMGASVIPLPHAGGMAMAGLGLLAMRRRRDA